MKQFRPAKKRITVSAGESVRIIRELQGFSQNQLAQRTGIPQATLSAIENDRVRLGVERSSVIPPCWSSRDGKTIFKLRHNPLLQPTR
jgi:DNA-binding XRE family transcriptional regulator